MAGPLPLYGTWFATKPNRSKTKKGAKWVMLPTPAEPYESESGLALSSATNSWKLLAGTELLTLSSIGTTVVRTTGAKSFCTSKLKFLYSAGLNATDELL